MDSKRYQTDSRVLMLWLISSARLDIKMLLLLLIMNGAGDV